MSEQSAVKRTRASVPRPRSGCKTCKKRHVKCDETKPECLKCQQTGRRCDGYTASTIKATSRLSALASTLLISSYEIPFKIPGSQNDRRIFHYFCVHASKDLAGPSQSDFWTRLVLQCSQDLAVVRSALLALSYEHLNYTKHTDSSPRRAHQRARTSLEGLEQHHKAFKQLRRYVAREKKQSLKAVLICHILFYYFECTSGSVDAAHVQLQMALAVLKNQNYPDASLPGTGVLIADPDMQELVKTLSRMDAQAALLNTNRMPELDLITDDVRTAAAPCVGPVGFTFKSLQDADFALAKLENWTTRLVVDNSMYQSEGDVQIPSHLLAQKEELALQCIRWLEALEAFETAATSSSNSEENDDQKMRLANFRLGLFCQLNLLQGVSSTGSTNLLPSDVVTAKIIEQLTKLIPSFHRIPQQRVSISEASPFYSRTGSISQVASPSGESIDDGDISPNGTVVPRLVPPLARSRSSSPSYPSSSMLNSRSFCAQGNSISILFILAAKTTSSQTREALISLLGQILHRREGVWSAATAYNVLLRLQGMGEQSPTTLQTPLAVPDLLFPSESGSAANFPGGDESMREEYEASDYGSHIDDNASDASGLNPNKATSEGDGLTLSQRAREYASQALVGRPFCAVAACLLHGYHGELCVWCQTRVSSAMSGDEELSLEDIGAHAIGGVNGFERLLQENR